MAEKRADRPRPVSPALQAALEQGRPPPTQLAKASTDRDAARSQAADQALRLREAVTEAEAYKNLAAALTRSIREIRQDRDALAVRLDRLSDEVASLQRYRADIEAAWRTAEQAGAYASAELSASERARARTDSQIRKLREEIRSLRRRVDEIAEERDEALLRRSDAVRSSLESIRSAILDEL